MPRIGTVVAQNTPHHIVQRGHNKNAVFVENEYYSYYLNTLVECTQ
jgi:putative transposase